MMRSPSDNQISLSCRWKKLKMTGRLGLTLWKNRSASCPKLLAILVGRDKDEDEHGSMSAWFRSRMGVC